MENSNVNRLSFGASLTAKLSSLMMIVIHLYCLLTFYNGVIVTGNGLIGYAGGFNVVDVIENTLNVASDAFSGGAGALVLLLPALHVAFLIAVIVNFINAFIRFFFLFGGGRSSMVLFLTSHSGSYFWAGGHNAACSCARRRG